jgi:hypothetical protein
MSLCGYRNQGENLFICPGFFIPLTEMAMRSLDRRLHQRMASHSFRPFSYSHGMECGAKERFSTAALLTFAFFFLVIKDC